MRLLQMRKSLREFRVFKVGGCGDQTGNLIILTSILLQFRYLKAHSVYNVVHVIFGKYFSYFDLSYLCL